MWRKLLLLLLMLPLSLSLGTLQCIFTDFKNCISWGVPILGFSNYTNAHIEVGNPTEMYYDKIVLCCRDKYLKLSVKINCSEPFLRIPPPWNIDGILYYFNLHAEIPEGIETENGRISIYGTTVCISNPNASLVCGTNGSYEVYLLRLSNWTNAHVELPNYTNYPYLIGCNLSYKDGTICDEDKNCLSFNCAPDFDNITKACSPSGYCYHAGNFYENLSCADGYFCFNEAWTKDGDIMESACYCVTFNNASWYNASCCGDDNGENLRTYKTNFDYDLYLDERDVKGNKIIMGNYSISKNCFADYCIEPKGCINITWDAIDEFSLGFFYKSYGDLRTIIKKGEKLIIKENNSKMIISLRGYDFSLNLTGEWDWILIVYNRSRVKIYLNRNLVYDYDFGTSESIDGNISICSKIDELFLVERAIDIDEIKNYNERMCGSYEVCLYNSTFYNKSQEINGYVCDGRFWDKVPEIETNANPSTIILEYGNSTNITIKLFDDDSREDWVRAWIIDKSGNVLGELNLSKDIGRKVSTFNSSFEFSEEGYYDLKVNFGDKNSNVTKIFPDFIFVARTAGIVDRIWVEPKFIKTGDIVNITLSFYNPSFDIPANTTFDLDFEGRNITVLEKFNLTQDLPANTTINITFRARVWERYLLQNIIPILRYSYYENGTLKSYAVIPRVVFFKITLPKKIYYVGEKIRVIAEPWLYRRYKISNVETRIRIYDSKYRLFREYYLGNVSKVDFVIDTKDWPCDLYILEISGHWDKYYGETGETFVVTGCYV